MGKMIEQHNIRNPQAGITMIETLLAAVVLVIGSVGMLSLIVDAIATNNRNRMDSTQTMLATSILEQIHSTFNGIGTSDLTDCAGTTWNIQTTIPNSGTAGAQLIGANIDYSQTSPPSGYYMNYVISTPCTSTGAVQGVYDVRWHLDWVGHPAVKTKSYLITVSAKLRGHGEGNKFFSLPVTLRFMAGS
jgi:Tfp pilus assembly protein PilV